MKVSFLKKNLKKKRGGDAIKEALSYNEKDGTNSKVGVKLRKGGEFVNSRKKALPNTFFLYNMNSKPPKAM
jgi:hypothetical protein